METKGVILVGALITMSIVSCAGGGDKPADDVLIKAARNECDKTLATPKSILSMWKSFGYISSESAVKECENITKTNGYISKGGGTTSVGDYVATITYDTIYAQDFKNAANEHHKKGEKEGSSKSMDIVFRKTENGWVSEGPIEDKLGP